MLKITKLCLGLAILCFGVSAHSQSVYVTNFSQNYSAINAVAKEMGGKIVSAISALQKASAGENADIATEAERRDVNIAKNTEKAKAVMQVQPSPDACGSRTIANYSESMRQAAIAVTRGMGASASARAKHAQDSETQAASVLTLHKEKYCDGAVDPACRGARAADNGRGEQMKNADAQASSLLSGAGDYNRSENLTYTDEQKKAALAYIDNTTDATDQPKKLSEREAETDSGRSYEGLRLVYESRISMARQSLFAILGSRLPVQNSGEILSRMQETATGGVGGSGAWMQERLASLKKGSVRQNISQMELLKLDIDRRYSNPDWYAAIGKASDSSLLREMVLMQATFLNMEYMKLRDREVSAAIAAQQAMESIRAEIKPRLLAARIAASTPVSGSGGK